MPIVCDLTHSLLENDYVGTSWEFVLSSIYIYNKRSVLRRQSRDTNRNTKRSMYCQYG